MFVWSAYKFFWMTVLLWPSPAKGLNILLNFMHSFTYSYCLWHCITPSDMQYPLKVTFLRNFHERLPEIFCVWLRKYLFVGPIAVNYWKYVVNLSSKPLIKAACICEYLILFCDVVLGMYPSVNLTVKIDKYDVWLDLFMLRIFKETLNKNI